MKKAKESGMRKILVMNGPNLNMLGIREPGVYGTGTLADLEKQVLAHAKRRNVAVAFYQSNAEGKLINRIHKAFGRFDGIVYNPGAHTHYSYAVRDALGSVDVPCVEVHLSDIDAREAFRQVSVTAPACVAQVKGRGFQGYCDAIDVLLSGARTRLGEGFESRYPKGQLIVASPEAGDGSADETAGEAGGLEKADSANSNIGPVCDARAQAERLARVRAAVAEKGAAAFCVRDTSNVRWVCAFDGVFDEERAHALVVTPDRAVLHTDSRYEDACLRAAAGTLVEVDAARMRHTQAVAHVLGLSGKEREGAAGAPVMIGIEDDIALSEYRCCERDLPAAVLWETNGLVAGLRAVKDASEVARLRAAQTIADAAFSHIVSFMRPGMTERDVQIELEDFMVRRGAEGCAFPSIVAAGANGASPHAVSGGARLEVGQCVVLDFGARARGYCSDMTRTVFLGEPSAKMRDAYETIRRANEEVEALLRPGVTGREAHELAERVLAEGGFAGRMGHGLGHGVGIDIHEEPSLSPRNDRALVAGNVVTVEPGIYLPGEFGMRLEDFGVVTESGFETFTQSTHDMVIL